MKYQRSIVLAFLLINVLGLDGQEFIIGSSVTYADGQSSTFTRVKPGDTVWIQSGTRTELAIANFHGVPGNPIIFANLNGQVIIETSYNYGLGFGNCSYFKLAGQSGNGFTYGIKIGRVSHPSGMGITVGNKSTDFEIENCEISDVGFAGIMAKTEPSCKDPATFRANFTQYNTVIHDCYIHDVEGEGMYIGSSFYKGYYLTDCDTTILPSVLIGVRVYHNRIERTGYDGIQISSTIRDCEIHHNKLTDCGYRMVNSQMCGIIIGGGTLAKCHSNQIINCYATGILVFGMGGTEVFNNLIVRPGKRYLPDNPLKPESGIFLSDKTDEEKTFYGVYNNTIIQPKSDGIRIDNTVSFEVRIFNNAIIDPGAFDFYEQDNTDRTGNDSYIFNTAASTVYKSSNNFFNRSLSSGGFVNVAGDDFHLLATSPLIDAGLNLGLAGVITDLDDRIRPVGINYDIGAYEYSSSQSVDENPPAPEFSVSSIEIGPDKTLTAVVIGGRDMKVRICLTDLQGKAIVVLDNQQIAVGRNLLSIPVNASGMVILTIQSDRLSYAHKIIFL